MAATKTWFSQINKYFKKCLGAFELKADALSMTQFFLEAASFSPHLCHVQYEKAEGVLERLPSYSDVGWRVGAGLGWGSSRDTLSMLKSHCKYSNKNMSLKKKNGENSLVVQWLGLNAFTAGTPIQSPVRNLRTCKLLGTAKRKRSLVSIFHTTEY